MKKTMERLAEQVREQVAGQGRVGPPSDCA